MKLAAVQAQPYAFRADAAAAYLGMSKSKFLDLVRDGRLPKPGKIDGVTVWKRAMIEGAFDALFDADQQGVSAWD